MSLSADERARGLVTVSAGNHAQALAWAARIAGASCTVVMPTGAPASKIDATRGYGAEVVLHDDRATLFDRLAEVRDTRGLSFVHPFDDAEIIAGAGTTGLEILEDLPDADVVVVPIGGGGLISGIATVVKARRPETRVIGVEPERSNAFHLALAAGEPVPITPESIADGLNAPFAGTVALAQSRDLVDEVVLVSEEEIAAATRFLYARAKLACEPAGAAATAALRSGKLSYEQGESIVVVVSGGNVATETAVAILSGR